MSDTTDTDGSSQSLEASVSPYNTYGLATQGFVWAAISSVSGDWGKGHVKTVNGVSPDENCNVGVSSISSLDYSGELNQINSDFSATIGGVSGHKVLSDKDETRIRSDISTQFESVCSLIPTEATSANKLADKQYVITQIESKATAYRGSWSNWTAVPTDSEQYPKDSTGNKIPKSGDYLVVLSVTDYPSQQITGTWRFKYVGTWSVNGKDGWTPEYEMSSISFTTEQWAAINSGITSAKLASFIESSARWDNVSREFESLSSGIYKIAFEVETTSANNRSVFMTVSSLSSGWEAALSVMGSASADWNNAFAETSATSAGNRAVYATVSETSGRWQTTSNTVEASAANWNSVYLSVLASSAKWDESEGSTKAYTDMVGTSALTSANKYTDDKLSPVSTKLDGFYLDISSASGNWNNASAEVSETSADYRNLYSAFSEASSKYESAHSTTSAQSGYWQSTFITVSSLSATWNEAAGSTKEYTNMMATSALTSAKAYSDGKLAEANEYSKFTAASAASAAGEYANFASASALTAANEYTNESCRNIYDEFKRYADLTSNAALTASKKYTDDSLEVALSGDRGYTRFIGASALSSANAYTDATAWTTYSSSCNYADYKDLLAAEALSTYTDESSQQAIEAAAIYAAFASTCALTTANTYTDSITGRINRTVTYDVPWDSANGIEYYSTLFQNPTNGDVIILKKGLFEGSAENFRFTSFTYCSGSWMAMNGDYDTKSVFFTENLTTTTDIGSVKVNPYTGNAVISSKGKNVNTVFNELFRVEKEPDAYPPVFALSSSGLSLVESGASVIPMLTIIPMSGHYSFGPASTSHLSSFYASFGNGTVRTLTTSISGVPFETVVATDSISSHENALYFSVTGNYTEDTVVPVTNIGNQRPEKKILEGSTEAIRSSEMLVSYRKMFYGSLSENVEIEDITSALIRSLEGSTDFTPTSSTEVAANYGIGKKSFIVAVPSFCIIKRIIDQNGFNANIINAFDSSEVNVNGASGGDSIPYKVYVKNSACANDIENIYRITFKD